jgi:16S rRNA (cytosine967-C5)-methyltransferase
MSKTQRINNVSKSPRACAISLLVKCNEGAFSNEIVPSTLNNSAFDQRDRALITKIVYSTLRQQIRIDHVLTRYSKRQLNKIDPVALNALRSIVSQLEGHGDSHGVVNETIKAMPFSSKSFVNALARKITQDAAQGSLFKDEIPRIEASLPKWIFDEITETFDDSVSTCAALNATPAVTVVGIRSQDLSIEGARRGAIVPESYLVESQGSIGDLDDIKRGNAIVIDQGSQVVVQTVDAQPGMNVLDVCAAPGGKTFLLSSRSQNVVSIDQTLSRMRKLVQTRERVHADNVIAIVADGSALPLSTSMSFDRVIVDAPCSGLGVLRRRPDARLRVTSKDVDELVDIQKQLLEHAIGFVARGGKLIYSVCTFTKRETLEIDEWIEKTFPGWKADDLRGVHPSLVEHGRGVLLPPSSENDAMFALRLSKA